jgi:hypothetical protein
MFKVRFIYLVLKCIYVIFVIKMNIFHSFMLLLEAIFIINVTIIYVEAENVRLGHLYCV